MKGLEDRRQWKPKSDLIKGVLNGTIKKDDIAISAITQDKNVQDDFDNCASEKVSVDIEMIDLEVHSFKRLNKEWIIAETSGSYYDRNFLILPSTSLLDMFNGKLQENQKVIAGLEEENKRLSALEKIVSSGK